MTDAHQPIILCPLRFEIHGLRRAGLDAGFDARCIGPGAAAVERAANAIGRTERPVVLAGLAGAISARCAAGQAVIVDEVVDPDSQLRWRPPLALETSKDAASPIVITSTGAIAATAADRQQLHKKTGADLVDQESVPFARCASSLGWTWAIVRGVSDDVRSALPAEVADWVNSKGGIRRLRVAASLLRRPSRVHELFGLRRRSRDALQAVAERLLMVFRPQVG